jgi:hypothetical protein
MKKIIYLALFTGSYLLSSSQQNKQAPDDGGGGIDPCPPGQCSNGVTWTIDQFNFHKPRTDCQSKFGLCIRGHLGPHCVPCFGGAPYKGINNGKVSGWYNINGSKLELHIPSAIQDADGFRGEDLTIFEVDDNAVTIFKADKTVFGYLKGGKYTVKKVNDELIVLLDLVL